MSGWLVFDLKAFSEGGLHLFFVCLCKRLLKNGKGEEKS
ncbi:hypothetical protein DB29_00402 [Shouchella clausii]|nr:hypothetical protein DB29_00402 [Shouchella clausii]